MYLLCKLIIFRAYDLSTNTVRICIDKYIDGETYSALFGEQRKGHLLRL